MIRINSIALLGFLVSFNLFSQTYEVEDIFAPLTNRSGGTTNSPEFCQLANGNFYTSHLANQKTFTYNGKSYTNYGVYDFVSLVSSDFKSIVSTTEIYSSKELGLEKIVPNGNSEVYVWGRFKDTLKCNGKVIYTNKSSSSYTFILLLDASGNLLNSKILTFYCPTFDMDLISTNKLACIFTYNSTIVFDNTTFAVVDQWDANFVVFSMELSSTTNKVNWKNVYGGQKGGSNTLTSYDYGGMILCSNDSIYFSGSFSSSSLSLGSSVLTNNVKYGFRIPFYGLMTATNGKIIWANKISTSGMSYHPNKIYKNGNSLYLLLYDASGNSFSMLYTINSQTQSATNTLNLSYKSYNFGGSNYSRHRFTDVLIDNQDNLWLSGYYDRKSLTINNITFSNPDSSYLKFNTFIYRCNLTDSSEYGIHITGSNTQKVMDLNMDNQDNKTLYLSFLTCSKSQIKFDTTELNNLTDYSLIFKLIPDSASSNQQNSTQNNTALPCSDLFISEYIEGDLNNQALELYNPTTDTIDLSAYAIKIYGNGDSIASDSITLTGNLLPDQTYVIANANCEITIQSLANLLTNNLTFDGNDAVALFKNKQLLDLIGIVGSNYYWEVDTADTKDNVLVRKYSIAQGDTNWLFATTGWEAYAATTFNFLGNHSSTCYGSPSLTSSLDNKWTIETISPIYNEVAITDAPYITTIATFYATDSSHQTIYDSYTDNSSSSGWQWKLDMGKLPSNAILYAQCYAGNVLLKTTTDLKLNIIPKPDWLNYGSISKVTQSQNTISMEASIPLNQNFKNYVPSYIQSIGSKLFSIENTKLDFQLDFDMATKATKSKSTVVNTKINTLEKHLGSFTDPLNVGYLTFDNDFTISALKIYGSVTSPQFNITLSNIGFSVAPGVSMRIDAGLSHYHSIGSRYVMGTLNNQWGFIDNNGEKSKIVVASNGNGYVRNTVSVFWGLAEITGSFNTRNKVGGGLEYISLPSPQTKTIFGGEVEVGGSLKLTVFWFFDIDLYDAPFYKTTFGDNISVNKVADSFDEIWNTSSITYSTDASLEIPEKTPQPFIGTNNEHLYTVWVQDKDSVTADLLLSKLNSDSSKFGEEIAVVSNQHSISNPKLSVFSSGSTLITWSQNRYTNADLPQNITVEELFKAQDIWAAVYDVNSNEIKCVARMADDTSAFDAGRMEGEATVAINNNDKGIISWIVADQLLQQSQIWYSLINNSNGNWSFTNPQQLIALSGTNRNIQLAYTNDDNIIAIWLNDADGMDSTLNENIFYAIYSNGSWTTPQQLVTANTGATRYNDLQFSFAANKGLLCWTSSIVSTNNDFYQQIQAIVYNNDTKNWEADIFAYNDTINYIQLPRSSVSADGIASITFQTVPMFQDTTNIDQGELVLYLNNLTNNSGWVLSNAADFITDTTAYVWDLTTGFGKDNQFYLLTQEIDKTGVNKKEEIRNGVQFGRADQNMVIRGIKINSDLSFEDIAEPLTSIEKGNYYGITHIKCYPNPTTENTIIEITLENDSYVKLEISDIAGKKINGLLNQKLAYGKYKSIFNAGNLPAGVYLITLTTEFRKQTLKLLVE